MPPRIAFLLHVVRILLGYGRHLAATVEHRAAAPGFSIIAACFGTSSLSHILARLQRGILRAVALERVLLARAASGRDVEFVQPRTGKEAKPAALADPPGGQSAVPPAEPSATPPAALTAATRPARLRGRFADEFYIPTLEELEAQVRRRPLGRTILDICLDLAVLPGLCSGPFHNQLFDIMHCYGGSVSALTQERVRREQAFDCEQDKRPGSDWSWINATREMIRKVLGFFVGEEPVDPFDQATTPCVPGAALATGPP